MGALVGLESLLIAEKRLDWDLVVLWDPTTKHSPHANADVVVCVSIHVGVASEKRAEHRAV